MCKNQHVTKYLNNYINSNKNFAVMLKGGWGTGKTYFIQKFIVEYHKDRDNKKRKKKFIHISLRGITTVEQLAELVFSRLYVFWHSKIMLSIILFFGFAWNCFKLLIPITSEVNAIDGALKEDTKIKCIIKDGLMDWNTQKRVYVFDDFERSGLDIDQLMNYMNSLVEIKKIKMILIANEDKLFCQKNSEEDKPSHYKEIKEKLVGKTFKIEGDANDAIKSFIEQTSPKCSKFLAKQIDLLVDIYEKSEHIYEHPHGKVVRNKDKRIFTGRKNLRIMNYACHDFDDLYVCLSKVHTQNKKFMSNLIKIYFPVHIEFHAKDMADYLLKIMFEKYEFYASDKEPLVCSAEHNPLCSYFPRDFKRTQRNTLLSKETWENILIYSCYDKEQIQKEINKLTYFVTVDTPKNFLKLLAWWTFTDEEFEENYKYIQDKFEANEILVDGDLMLLLASEIGLVQEGLLKISLDELKKKYIKYIEQNEEGLKFQVIRNIHTGDADLYAGHSLNYQSNEFSAVRKALNNTFRKRSDVQLYNDVNNIQSFIENNEYWNTALSNSEEVQAGRFMEYANLPVLKDVNPKDFIDVCALRRNDYHTFSTMITNRYIKHYRQPFQQEKSFVDECLKEIEQRWNELGKMDKYRLKFIKEALEKGLEKINAETQEISIT